MRKNFGLCMMFFLVIFYVTEAYAVEHEEEDVNKFDWEFVKNLILVIVPLLTGSLLVVILSNRIQDRNAKILRKKELVNVFVHSAKEGFTKMDTFLRRTSEEYSDSIDMTKQLEKNEISFTLNNFPTDEKDFPKNKLAVKWSKLDEDLSNLRVITSEFISLTHLYVDDQSILKDYLMIHTHLTKLWFMLKQMMDVTKLKDFGNIMRALSKERSEIKSLIGNFENTLIDLKMRNVPV